MIVSVDGLTGFGDAIHAVFRRQRSRGVLYIRFVIQQSLFLTKI